MKKIAVITATRAEYGLLAPLIRRMSESSEIKPFLVVSGTHLLEKYGNTVKYIEKDGFRISHVVDILDEDYDGSEIRAAEAIGRAVTGMADILMKEAYDAIIVLGDRFELLGFCDAAVICRIPIIHIHGGEITEGAVDDKIRHSITKLASIHFPSIQEYADRIIQMGEDPQNVYPVGALGIDNIKKLKLMTKEELLTDLEIHTERQIAAVTFHPVTTLSRKEAVKETQEVMEALLDLGVYSVVTMPNSDVGGDEVFERILYFAENHPDRMCIKKSLGQTRYLSLLGHADIMVGNSSSGILESASFRLPTVDIGDRQKGRFAPVNVIHCDCRKDEILKAMKTGLSEDFKKSLTGCENVYGDGNTAEKIVSILEEIDLNEKRYISKSFFDMH